MSTEKPQVVKAKVGFFKLFFTSCLGTLMALGVIVGGLSYMGYQAAEANKPTIKPNTVLKLKLNKPMPELSNNVEQNPYDIKQSLNETVGLTDACNLIDLAAEDDNIKGIYLDLDGNVPMGWASSKVLRQKLVDFRESGKFIIAHADVYNQKSYYMASTADNVYLHPEGGFSFFGFYGQITYLKGMLDKLGVKMQIYYAGKFKSATEPYRRKDMTPENRKQVTEYLSGLYTMYLEDIAASRNISVDELRAIADEARIRQPQDAVAQKLVDATKYKDEVLAELRDKLGTNEDDKMEVASLKKYLSVNKDKIKTLSGSDKVAVIYAEGGIVDGQGDRGSIGGDKYAGIIRKLRKDDKVKAIVMRVNSGGGSALASDIIWRELEKAKEQGIKVVTSMGDVAASGGYYIAANSDLIYAEDRTITGSIGVFGIIPNTRGLMEDHLGITMDTVRLGRYSKLGSSNSYFEFDEKEGALIQESVAQVYTTFKTRVSEGRGMSMEAVDSVAQGRVWLGHVAQNIGLVDSLGGLEDAVTAVAKLANLGEDNYRIVRYPKTKSFQEELLEALSGEETADAKAKVLQTLQASMTPTEFQEYLQILRTIKEVKSMKGVQMRLPYELTIE